MEYIRNIEGISMNIHNKEIKEQNQRTQRRRLRRRLQWGGRPIESVFFVSAHFLIMKNSWIFLIYSLYISYLYVLNIFHIFSFVCFVIYSVNSRSGHDRSPTFGSISHISVPKLTFSVIS